MAKKEIEKVITPVFRVSFPQVFEPKAFGGGDPKFSVVMLFDKKADLTKIKALIKKAALAKWPEELPKTFVNPRKNGDKKEYNGYAGMIYATASSLYAPGVIDEQKEPIINPKEFYAGCYAIASVNAFAYDKLGKRGVSFGLQNLMKINDGEPLGGGSTPEQDFESIELPETTEVLEEETSILDL